MTGIQRDPTSYAFLRRDSERARLLAQQAQITTEVGRVLLKATSVADESTVKVTFANVFVEKPYFFPGGGALADNVPAVAGSFPTATAVVIEWDVVINGPFTGYLGATLGIVTTGIASQQLWFDYMFTGRALSFNAGFTPTSGTATA